MSDIQSLWTEGILQYLLTASVVAGFLTVSAWLIIKLAHVRASVYRHMIWLYCLIGIVVLPAIWLYGPKLTLAILPTGPVTVAMDSPIDFQVPAEPLVMPIYVPTYDTPPAENIAHVEIPVEKDQPFPVKSVLVSIYLACVLLMFARLAIAWLKLGRIRKSATLVSNVDGLGEADTGKLRILVTDKLDGPVCFGLFRPIVLLPRDMYTNSTDQQLRMVLNHELAHIQRRDCVVNIFQRFVESVFFFHPLVWWASFQLTQQREQICDNYVLAKGSTATDYTTLLAQIVEQGLERSRFGAIALFEGGLLQRVRLILDPKRSRKTKLSLWTVVLCTLAVAITFAIFTSVRLEARTNETPEKDVTIQTEQETDVQVEGEVIASETSALPPPGRYGLMFDGKDDYVEIPASDNLKLDIPFTIEVWLKPELPIQKPEYAEYWDILSQGFYAGKGKVDVTGFGLRLLRLPHESPDLLLSVCTANNGANHSGVFGVRSSNVYPSDWLHIAVAFDYEEYRIYGDAANGSRREKKGYLETAHNHPLIIGKYIIPDGNSFRGVVGEIRIWNTARTRQEIDLYKNMPLTANEPNLVACLTFEEGKGQLAYDISPNKNNARLGSAAEADKAEPQWFNIDMPSAQIRTEPDVQVEGRDNNIQSNNKFSKSLNSILYREWKEYFAEQTETRIFNLHIVHTETKSPIEDVSLEIGMDVERAKNRVKWIEYRDTTDKNGSYKIKISVMEPKRISIKVQKDGFVSASFLWNPQVNDLPAEFTIPISPVTSIGGMVQNDKGEPIEDVYVNIWIPMKDHVRYLPNTLKTDSKGRWQCDSVPQNLDGISFTFSHNGYTTHDLHGRFGEKPVFPIEKLREKTAVVTLQESLVFPLRVVDENNDLIVDANILPYNYGYNEITSIGITKNTEHPGEFVGIFNEDDIGKIAILTAKASGYAPAIKEINLPPKNTPVEFKLGPPCVIKGKVVDENNKPIKGAWVRTENWGKYRFQDNGWFSRTDSKGRFTWTQAPQDEIRFGIGQESYLSTRLKMSPSEKGYIITLKPNIRVRGTVADAETGKIIEQFRLMPTSRYTLGNGLVIWRLEARLYKNGQFEFTRSKPYNDQLIAIEADGYRIALSNPIRTSNGEVLLEFRLHKQTSPDDITKLPRYIEQKDVKQFLSKYMQDAWKENKPNVQVEGDKGKKGKLQTAIADSDIDEVKKLIEEGADVNAKDEIGRVPLHFVRNKAVAELLIAKGADVNAKAKDGSTLLHIMAWNEQRKGDRVLLALISPAAIFTKALAWHLFFCSQCLRL